MFIGGIELFSRRDDRVGPEEEKGQERQEEEEGEEAYYGGIVNGSTA